MKRRCEVSSPRKKNLKKKLSYEFNPNDPAFLVAAHPRKMKSKKTRLRLLYAVVSV